MRVSVKVLGSGAATGTPAIGCECPVCRSDESRNKRLRPSILLEVDGQRILVDAGPDVRLQMLREGVRSLQGLILTHSHYDHTAGLDELRPLSREKALPSLMSEETLKELRQRFYYLFEPNPFMAVSSKVEVHLLGGRRGQVEFLGLPIRYVTYEQGGMVVNGLRIGPFAYVTDIKDWSEEILPDLMGVEQLILGAVHWAPSNFHLNIEEAIAFARRIEAKRVWLTHLSHGVNSMDEERLPEGVFFAYDGMELNFALDDGQSENS